jgi:CRP-like cAMP-binding protein
MNTTFHYSSHKNELPGSNMTSRNDLLRELLAVPAIADELLPELKVVSLEINQVLHESGDKVEALYFPLDAIVSTLAIMEDGTTLETAMVGRDSLVGISTLLGSELTRQWNWVTVSGSAIQLEPRILEKIFVHNEQALKLLLRAYRSLVTQISQRCVCNTRHTILERLCCWLLMIHDRVGGANLRMTQEMIASRIGARRAGITVAAGMLQDIRAIEYRRGQLHIQRRDILEETVCECYAIMKADFDGLTIRSYSTPSL